MANALGTRRSWAKGAFWDHSASRPRKRGPDKRRLVLERLEPRLLLSADGLAPLALTLSDDADDVTLLLDEASGLLRVVDTGTSAVFAEQRLDETSEVAIQAGGGDDRLKLDASLPASLALRLDGGAGADTLVGPDADAAWRVTGLDSGTVGAAHFADFESLEGAADNRDTFVFGAYGALSGTVEGGAGGFDTVEFSGWRFDAVSAIATGADSGSVDRDGNRVVYAGMEPVDLGAVSADFRFEVSATPHSTVPNPPPGTTDSADTITLRNVPGVAGQMEIISASSPTTFESVTFLAPSSSLTIDAGDGDDIIVIESLDPSFVGQLIVIGGGGNDTITGISTYDTTYRFGDGWGNDTLADPGGTARLEFADFGGDLRLRSPSAGQPEIEGLVAGVVSSTLDRSGAASFVSDVASFETPDQASALVDGLNALADLGDRLNDFGDLAAELSVLQQSIGDSLGIGEILRTRLLAPIEAFRAAQADPTLEELVAALEATSGSIGDVTFGLAVVATKLASGDLSIELGLEATRVRSGVAIDLGDDVEELLTTDALSSDLGTGFRWNVVLELGADSSSSAVRFDTPIEVTADLDLSAFEARTGFLGLAISGSVAVDADVALQVGPAGVSSPFAALPGLAISEAGPGTALYDVDVGALALPGVVGIADDPGDPATVRFADDLLDDLGPTTPLTHDFDTRGIIDFFFTDAGVVRSQLRQFGTFLDTFATTTLGIPIPLTLSTTLRDVFPVGDAFRSELLDRVELPPNTAATPVRDLNDGDGVRTKPGNDIVVKLRGGQSFEVDLDHDPDLATLGDLAALIETAAGALVTDGLFEVAADPDSGALSLLDRSEPVDSNAFAVEALGDSEAVSDLGLDARGVAREVGGQTVFAIDLAPNPGPNFDTVQQLLALANLGPLTTVSSAQYVVGADGPTLDFVVSIADGSLPPVQDTLALFDLGPLTGIATSDPVTVTPAGVLNLPFQIQLTAVGFQVTETTALRNLNTGNGVRSVPGADDIRVQLLDGTSFGVDLSVDPAASLAADLGIGSVAGDDIELRLNDGTVFSVDLNADALTSDFGPAETLGELAQRIRDAADAAGVAAGDFEVVADLARGVLRLRDLSLGSDGFAASDLGASTAAADLGLTGPALPEDGALVLEIPVVTLGDVLERIRVAAAAEGLDPAQFSVRIDPEGTGVLLVDASSAAAPLTGTATSASSGAELEDANAAFGSAGDLVGRTVFIVAGTGAGQSLRIVGNSATTLTLEAPWDTPLDTDSEYVIPTASDVVALGGSFARVDLGLFGPGSPQPATSETLVADLNWGLGVRSVAGLDDIEIRLRSGASFRVDLDYDPVSATLETLARRIETAAGALVTSGFFEVVIDPAGSLNLVDRSPALPGNAFEVVALAGSEAARDLGLDAAAVERDVDFDGSPELALAVQPPALAVGGGPLHGDTPSAHFGLRQDGTPHIQLDASLGAAGVQASGLWGPVAVGVSGGSLDAVASNVSLTLTFTDSQLRGLTEGLADAMALIDSQSAAGSATLDLPLSLASALPGVASGPANLRIAVPDFSDLSVPPTLSFSDASPTDTQVLLEAAAELEVDDVLAALGAAADYLVDLETEPLIAGQENPLALRLPGLNQSLGQLLAFGRGFRAQVDALAGDPATTLTGIRDALDALPGISTALAFDPATRALALDVDLDLPELMTRLPLSLDLTALGVDLASLGLVTAGVIVDSQESSPLEVTADGALHLALGIDLNDPSNPTPFLFDTTNGSFEVRAEGVPLDFDALFGSIAVRIENGSYALDLDGAGTDPAAYGLDLADDPGDGRHLFSELDAATDLTLAGTVDAILPVAFPEAITAPGVTDIDVAIGDLGDVSGTSNLSGPRVDDLVGQIDLSQNLDSFRLGFDELFTELDRLLDRAVFGQALPLVGTQLVDALDLTEQIRGKVSDNLTLISTGLENDILTPAEVRQALFDAFGPGGLGWLQDRNGDGFLNLEDDILLGASPTEVIFDLDLEMPPRTLEAPIDLDLLLPGLGLRSDARVEVTYAFSMPLVFGISVFDGVFLDVSALDEMTIDLAVTLPGPEAVLTGDPRLSFAVDGSIVRDRGSWIFDGFREGQSVTVTGSGANDGMYTIAAIDPTGRILRLEGGALIEGPIQGVSIQTASVFDAELGFLPFRVYDLADLDPGVAPTGLQGSYVIDLLDLGGNANDRLSRNELMTRPPSGSVLQLSQIPQLTDIHLRLETALADGAAFPPYRLDLNVTDWDFSTDGVSIADTPPTVAFDEVQFELVGFVQDFLGAAATRLRQAFEPLDGLVDFLNSEAFPILSLLFGRASYATASQLLGGEAQIGDFAAASLAMRTLVEGGKPFEKDIFTEFFEDVFGANEFDDITLPALADLTGEAWIDLGSFTVDGAAARAGSSEPLEPISIIRPYGTIDDPPMALSGSPELTFSGDTILRENYVVGPQDLTFIGQLFIPNVAFAPGRIEWSGGSWSSAGFHAGDYVTVSGTNDFDGFYRIADIADGGQELVLVVDFGDYANLVTDNLGLPVQASAVSVSGNQQTWSTDGFAVGQTIEISGTQENDGSYRVTDVTPTLLSLDRTLVAEGPASGVEIEARAVLTGNPQLSFDNLDLILFEINTITREDGRSWASDGFAEGQFFEIRGSASNDGFYRVDSISGTALHVEATLTDEGPVGGVGAESRGTILGRIFSIARDDLHPAQDAANGFVTTQLLPGVGAFDGILGVGLTKLIPGFFGIDPVEMPLLQDASRSFDLLLGETRFDDASDVQANLLLDYGTPELFVFLYQDFPLDKKRIFAELPIVSLFFDAIPGPQPFISISFEARADFALSWDATGLELFRATGNPDDLAEGIYFDDTEGVEPNPSLTGTEGVGFGALSFIRDEPQARILGGVGLGVFWGFDLKIFKVKIGAEIGLFLGTDYNFEDPDGDGQIRASEFDRLLGAGARPFTGGAGPLNLFGTPTETLNAYDLGARIEVRFDIFAKAKALFFTLIDIRINLVTLGGTIDLPRDPIDAPILASVDGSILRLNIGDGPDGRASQRSFPQADAVVDEEIYIGRDGSMLIVSGFGQHQTISGFGIESIVGFGGSGNDRIVVSDDVLIPVELHGGAGADFLQGGGGPASLFGDADADVLIAGAAALASRTNPFRNRLEGGSGDDLLIGGNDVDRIRGGSGNDRIFGGRGSDDIDGEAGIDAIDGGVGSDLIRGGADADFVVGGLGNDVIFGDAGPDLLEGGDGRDTIDGGSGEDSIYGGLGNDTLRGGLDADRIFGEQHNDVIAGGAHSDQLDGGGATDRVFGDTGPFPPDAAALTAPAGDDTIFSLDGNDFLDGQDGGDTYLLRFVGGRAISLVTVLDTGSLLGTDLFRVDGTPLDDAFLLRANTDGSLAFVALLNQESRVERINYTGVERIVVNAGLGDDAFAVDDTAAEVTLNGESGDDSFQIGQLFRSRRTNEAANVSVDDEFATIETTRGFLSDGISAPMTVNGGLGDDHFVVFHNKAVLSLNGDQGNDLIEVRAFALTGSQEPQRERTDISGGAGADRVEYAVNAPVNIDGGDDQDTLVVIGTEFGDDFVITEDGIFGAGLTVNFVNIELLRVDGAEGDDRFFVQSTSEKFVTELFGGLGSDTFNMSGDTPPVVSNDLRGHSGIVLHDVESNDPLFDGQKLYGISANVADNDEPFAVIRQTGGSTIVTEGSATGDSYEVVLTRRPETDVFIQALAPVPTPDSRERRALAFRVSSPSPTAVTLPNGTAVTLVFTAENWFLPQIVEVHADAVVQVDEAGLFTRPELGDSTEFSFDDSAAEGVRFGVINHLVLAGSESVDGSVLGVVASPTLTIANPNARTPEQFIGRSVTVTLADGVTEQRRVVTSAKLVGPNLELVVDRAWRTGASLPDASSSFVVELDSFTESGSVLAVTNPSVTIPDAGTATPEELLGRRVEIVSGSGAGQSRFIVAAEVVADGVQLTVDRGWVRDDVPSAMRLVQDQETQRGEVFAPNVLTFEFDVGTLAPVGPGSLVVSTIADLDAPSEFLALEAEGQLSQDLFVSGGSQGFPVSTTVPLSQAQLEELVADGRITFSVTPSAGVNSFITDNELTLELSFPVPDSSFLVRIDDAFVGKMSDFDESPAGLPPSADPGDERSTFTDSAASFPSAGEGLTGAILQIVGGPGAGQQRLILGQLPTDPSHTLILNGPWSTDPVPGESIYRIERYDGLAIPSLQVQVNDDDAAGLIVDETRGLDTGSVEVDSDTVTAVIEGSDGDQPGEQDVVRVRLSRQPTADVRVELRFDGAQLELERLDGTPVSFLEFTASDWDSFQTVVVKGADDLLREGFHSSLIEFDVTEGDADATISGRQDAFDIAADEALFSLGLTQLPSQVASVVADGVALVEADAQGLNGDYQVIGNKVVFVDASGREVARSGEITVTYDYVDAGFVGAVTAPVLVRILDDDAPTVLVRESGGSTDVVEFDPATVVLTPDYVRSETQTDNVFWPKVLTFGFDTGSLLPLGDGVLRVSTVSDLNASSEFLVLDAEGVVTSTLFQSGGQQQSRVSTSLALSQAQLESLTADGRVEFTITPSPAVNNLGPNDLTLELEFPAAVASRQTRTQSGNVFAPNVLRYEFDLSSLRATGDAILDVSAVADLDLGSEFLRLEAGGVFLQDLFVSGGLQGLPVTTRVSIPRAQLESLTVDGKLALTVTPSAAVNDFVTDNELTLTLSFPAEVRTETVHQDSYELVLTGAPTDEVTVSVTPDITKTTRTGGIRHDEVQLAVSSSDPRVVEEVVGGVTVLHVTFGVDDWDDPVRIDVEAVDDDFVDGGDTKEFAPGPNTVSGILGPVFIDGGGGQGSIAIGTPVLLPGETNERTPDGPVLDFTPGAGPGAIETMAVDTSVLEAARTRLGLGSVDELVGRTLEITRGAGLDRFWEIAALTPGLPGEHLLTLRNPSGVDPAGEEAPTADSLFAITSLSLNFFVDEATRVDFLFVHDEDSPADSSGVLTPTRLSGLNMGPDLVINGVLQPGGITYGNLEVLEINLGRGFNDFRVLGTHRREDGFQTWTLLNTGDDVLDPDQPDSTGDHVTVLLDTSDVVTATGTVVAAENEPTRTTISLELAAPVADDAWVGQLVRIGGDSAAAGEERRILSHSGDLFVLDRPWQPEHLALLAGEDFEIVNEADGAFALDTQGGGDFVDASLSTLPLVIFGGDGNDTILGGTADDLLVGDRGHVDYFDEQGRIVTRLGSAPEPITGTVTGAGDATLVDSAASFPTGLDDLRGLVVAITNGTGAGQTRLIVANTDTELSLDLPWVTPQRPGEVAPDATSEYRISTLPEDQTDGVVRGANLLASVDGSIGGSDTIHGGTGNDQILGGAAGDWIYAGLGEDWVLGDGGRIESPRDPLAPTAPGIGDLVASRALRILTIDRDVAAAGGGDVLIGDDGDDILIGGSDSDFIDGADADRSSPDSENDDLIFGDQVELVHRDGVITDPRFQALSGTLIYSRSDIDPSVLGDEAGQLLVDGTARELRLRNGEAPAWAEWQIVDLDHTAQIEAEQLANGGNRFGDDHIAGGPGDDVIFGQLGDDVIQGDGSIEDAIAEMDPSPVGASRGPDSALDLTPTLSVEAPGELEITPSFEAASDGDDYIEGGGGDDVVFGNLGQDDIVGGSSSFYTLVDRSQRPDGRDLLFGGSGQRIDPNHVVDGANGDTIVLDELHARDSDVLAGDNANIYRLVGTNGADGGGFLEFRYDQGRGGQRVLVRGVELLDYTPGGPDFRPDVFAGPAPDLGGGDEIHGESGDDFVYGMVGPDALFGDSQDDDLIGGWGADWISGGTGSDGVLGDDGRIYTGRYEALGGTPDPANPAHYNEPLNGVLMVDATDKVIRTPGDIQRAVVHPAGELFKQVDLTPFNLRPNVDGADDPFFDPLFADDIVYGGSGRDFLHGGAGDDAISGAEALALFFLRPVNPGDVLRFDPSRIEFADYDENAPRVKLDPFFLNFDAPLPAEGDEDAIFGDLGNDWIVGGPDNDHAFGGFGNDLLDMDDDKDTNGGANDAPDGPDAEIQDIAFGGAGRDVLNANTGGDRLIDWAGEFNSYLVPFAPFGAFTVSRGVPPHLFQFLYDLSAADGADPTRAADTGSDPTRNGEPEGELGLVTQHDPAWHDQTGGPIDPQPGNIAGGPRLTLRGVDFNAGAAQSFSPDSGLWTVSGGRLEVAPETLGGVAASVLHVGEYLPGYFEVEATINAGKPTGGLKSNAYVIFDYQSPTDFKFAGVNISIDKIQMGHVDADGWHVDVQTNAQLKPDTDYQLLLAINGLTATLVVDGSEFFSHAFAPRIDPWGYTQGLNEGLVGLGALNSVARIDNVYVKILYPEITFSHDEDFEDGLADMFLGFSSGDWQVIDGRFVGSGASVARSTFDLRVGPNSLLELDATLSSGASGGFFFDAYGPDDYKFASVDTGADQVVIGHSDRHGGWVIDAVSDIPFATGDEVELHVSLDGTTVSLSVDGHPLLGHAFNAVTVDGEFGLLAFDAPVSVDAFHVATDDMAFFDPAEALVAAAPAGAVVGGVLTSADLEAIVDEAVARWTASLDLDAGAVAALEAVHFGIAELSGQTLGMADGSTVWLDATAAGFGWFVDRSPEDDAEFAPPIAGARRAAEGGPAEGAMDLLTAVSHELGHVLGLGHDVLPESLEAGIRWTPDAPAPTSAQEADEASYVVAVLAAERCTDEEEEDPLTFSVQEISLTEGAVL